MKTKNCSRCLRDKPVTEFYRHRRPTGDGYQAYCKDCHKADRLARRGQRYEKRPNGTRINTKAMNFELDADLHARLKDTAQTLGATMARFIEDTIRERLDRGVCEDCGGVPLDGGRWCLRCFQSHTDSRNAPSWDPACGTDRGYQRHHRARERPCDPCRDAHTERARSRRTA